MTMKNNEISPVKKVEELEYAVLNSSAEEIAAVCARVGKVEFSARALGIACRYRGLDCVKALVEGGATFDYPFTNYMINTYGSYGDDFPVMLLDNFPEKGIKLFVVTNKIYRSVKRADGQELSPLSFEERVRTVDYLCENREKAAFDAGELLYYAILFKDEPMTEELKKRGAELTEYRRKMLTDKGKPDDLRIWTSILERLPVKNFAPVLCRLTEELGEKLHITKGIYEAISDKLYLPENLKAYLECFDEPKVNKTEIMKSAIDNNSTAGLAFAEREGWLKSPKKRDEMIRYATERDRTESTAWLLDFKNRTADLNAERVQAEKEQERELNASPNSVTVLKTLWSYKKREDGTIIINGYKGDRTEVSVPETIGKGTVTAIADGAFSPYHDGVIKKNNRILKTITSVTLPESITEIGERAFDYCYSLRSVNIPESVTKIKDFAFAGTAVENIKLPGSLKALGACAFKGCRKLRSVSMADGISTICRSAFLSSAIENIVLPGSLEIIEDFAFCDCVKLRTLTIPEGVTFIGLEAFRGCEMLETVELPRSLIEIELGDTEETRAFSFDDKLTVIVPKSSFAEKYCKEHKIHYVLKGDQNGIRNHSRS